MGATWPYNYHFVGGRKRINAERQRAAEVRRVQVNNLLVANKSKADIASELGVSVATVRSDIKKLASYGVLTLNGRVLCPLCGQWATYVSPEQVGEFWRSVLNERQQGRGKGKTHAQGQGDDQGQD